MIKRRVRFVQPVDFYADSDNGMKEAIKEYARDPCYSSDGAGENGCYGWKQARPYLMKAKPLPRDTTGREG